MAYVNIITPAYLKWMRTLPLSEAQKLAGIVDEGQWVTYSTTEAGMVELVGASAPTIAYCNFTKSDRSDISDFKDGFATNPVTNINNAFSPSSGVLTVIDGPAVIETDQFATGSGAAPGVQLTVKNGVLTDAGPTETVFAVTEIPAGVNPTGYLRCKVIF